ncbi:hypothetical protein H0H87_005153 [Tephrocybe sp. NHM501043]|nr:hypothetical protein H0H87_005153 [Tephrocybe sp. NHM501043]
MVLLKFNPDDRVAPLDCTLIGLTKLHTELNRNLKDINTTEAAITLTQDGIHPQPTSTYMKGLSAFKNNMYLLKFNTDLSATCFCTYAIDETYDLLTNHFGMNARVKAKPHYLIVRFIPYEAFNPEDRNDIMAIKHDNGLTKGSILLTSWLKHPDHCSPNQLLATLKITCSTTANANYLLQGSVFIAG